MFNKPGKSPRHQEIISTIGFELIKQIRQPRYNVWYVPLPVILGHHPAGESLNLVIPDVFVIDKESPNVPDDTGWRGNPMFIIEVADKRTEAIDTTVKFDLYQRYGVFEYWVVQLQAQNVHVYTLEGDKYALVDIYESGDIPGRIFPELTIAHERIFK